MTSDSAQPGSAAAPEQDGRAGGAEARIWFNGQLLPADQARVSVYDHGLLYGDGVFEGIRAYGGRVLKMRSHLHRLADSARHIDLTLPFSVDELERGIRETLEANGLQDGYVRLCVTRGEGTLGLSPDKCPRPNAFIIADTISLYPGRLYEEGMKLVTASTMRTPQTSLSPRIKSMNYLNNILAKIEALRSGEQEALMLNQHGFVAECTGDNIFIIRTGTAGETRVATPPLHAGILEGVTRNLVIELAERAGYPVDQVDLTRHDLYAAREAFLTGTAAEVVPVTQLDGRTIGAGRPGPVTAELRAAYRDLVADAPED